MTEEKLDIGKLFGSVRIQDYEECIKLDLGRTCQQSHDCYTALEQFLDSNCTDYSMITPELQVHIKSKILDDLVKLRLTKTNINHVYSAAAVGAIELTKLLIIRTGFRAEAVFGAVTHNQLALFKIVNTQYMDKQKLIKIAAKNDAIDVLKELDIKKEFETYDIQQCIQAGAANIVDHILTADPNKRKPVRLTRLDHINLKTFKLCLKYPDLELTKRYISAACITVGDESNKIIEHALTNLPDLYWGDWLAHVSQQTYKARIIAAHIAAVKK